MFGEVTLVTRTDILYNQDIRHQVLAILLSTEKQKFGKDINEAIYKEIDKFFEKMKERTKQINRLLESTPHQVDSNFYTMALETITPRKTFYTI